MAPTWNLVGHIGHQSVNHYGKFNYTDWKVGITKDWAGVTWGAAAIGTDAKKPFYRVLEVDGSGTITEKNTGDTTLDRSEDPTTAFLSKPFDGDELLKAVRATLDGAARRRQAP